LPSAQEPLVKTDSHFAVFVYESAPPNLHLR
jgi:hypothetical protein